MVLSMARPTRRLQSSLHQFRRRVPADVAERARGQGVTFTFPAEDGGRDVVVSAAMGGANCISRCELVIRPRRSFAWGLPTRSSSGLAQPYD